MSFSIPPLGASKKYTNQVALGLTNISIDNTTGTVTFSLNDGSSASWTFPVPANGNDGVGVAFLTIDLTGHLIATMTDSTTVDCGLVPQQLVELSQEAGNALVKKDDGYYVASTGVELSQEAGNKILSKADGLYVGSDISKVNVSDIKDDLVSTDTNKPLSANQGNQLALSKLDNSTDETNAGKVVVVDDNGDLIFEDALISIDDTTASSDTVYSSSKIETELGKKATVYYGISSLGFASGDEITVDGLIAAMANKTIAVISHNSTNNKVTGAPASAGTLEIIKFSEVRCSLRDTASVSNGGKPEVYLASFNNTLSAWAKINDNEEYVTQSAYDALPASKTSDGIKYYIN